jgi:predicted nuclease with RNAse H fold
VGRRSIALPPRNEVQASVTLAELRTRMAAPHARVVGIDLTGSDARPSGWALMHGDLVVTGMLHTFDELVTHTLDARPRLVSIDSPLSLPVGRDCTDDGCDCRAVGGITRHCERELKRRGINVYPCLIQSMQALTRRGILLAATLREHGVEVIESYPGAAQDIMRIPRKRASQEQLRAGLERFGLRGIRRAEDLTHDELDALTSAAVGAFYLAGLYEALGNDEERHLIIPSLAELVSPAVAPIVPAGSSTRLMMVGAGARNAQRALRDHDVMIGDWETYWHQVAADGASLRVAHVAGVDERKPRRPVFADVSLREDHPQRTRILRRWARGWSS